MPIETIIFPYTDIPYTKLLEIFAVCHWNNQLDTDRKAIISYSVTIVKYNNKSYKANICHNNAILM